MFLVSDSINFKIESINNLGLFLYFSYFATKMYGSYYIYSMKKLISIDTLVIQYQRYWSITLIWSYRLLRRKLYCNKI